MENLVPTMVQVHIARFTKERQLELLVLRRSPDVHLYPGIWQCVTGRVNTQESAVQAAIREVLEETSLIPLRMWTLPHVAAWYSPNDNRVEHSPCFGVMVAESSQPRLSNEHDAFEWLSPATANTQLLIPTQRVCVELFANQLESKLHDTLWNSVYEIVL